MTDTLQSRLTEMDCLDSRLFDIVDEDQLVVWWRSGPPLLSTVLLLGAVRVDAKILHSFAIWAVAKSRLMSANRMTYYLDEPHTPPPDLRDKEYVDFVNRVALVAQKSAQALGLGYAVEDHLNLLIPFRPLQTKEQTLGSAAIRARLYNIVSEKDLAELAGPLLIANQTDEEE